MINLQNIDVQVQRSMVTLSSERMAMLIGGGWRDKVDEACDYLAIGGAFTSYLIRSSAFLAPAAFCGGWILGKKIRGE